jgi:hypothetical protein
MQSWFRDDTLKRLGLAAVIVLAPGGFLLAAALTAKYHRKRRFTRSPFIRAHGFNEGAQLEHAARSVQT